MFEELRQRETIRSQKGIACRVLDEASPRRICEDIADNLFGVFRISEDAVEVALLPESKSELERIRST
jgi:hypothetical protein